MHEVSVAVGEEPWREESSVSALSDELQGEVTRLKGRVAELEADNMGHLRATNEKQARIIRDVHDALHRECDGTADLPAEIRALRSQLAQAEKERDEARRFSDALCVEIADMKERHFHELETVKKQLSPWKQKQGGGQ